MKTKFMFLAAMSLLLACQPSDSKKDEDKPQDAAPNNPEVVSRAKPGAEVSEGGSGNVGFDVNVCAEPVKASVVAATAVVGSGTPESCTEAEFKTKAAMGGRVTFDCGKKFHTITLTSVFAISKDTILDGGNSIALSGGKATRILKGAGEKTLQLQNITIQDGSASDDGGAGVYSPWKAKFVAINTKFLNNKNSASSSERQAGAISTHEGTAIIVNSRFEGNEGSIGAGINNLLSNLTIVNSTFIGNVTKPKGVGGAVYVDGALRGQRNGFVNICGTTFLRNASEDGAGIYWCGYTEDKYNSDDKLTVDRSEFFGNSGGKGAGIISACNGKTKVTNSTFSGNKATDSGGAITAYAENLELVNSTFVNNSAAQLGGAITTYDKPAIFKHLTIAKNSARHGGGVNGSKIKVSNSIIANNKSTNPWDIHHNCSDTLENLGGLVVFPDRVGILTDPNNRPCAAESLIADPKLDSLRNNSSPTSTVGLLQGSPAIGVGSGCEPTDQRGKTRKPKCDAGAFETP